MFAVWTFDVTSYIWVCSKAEFWKSVFFLREWETCGVVGFCAMFTVAPSEYCVCGCVCVCVGCSGISGVDVFFFYASCVWVRCGVWC